MKLTKPIFCLVCLFAAFTMIAENKGNPGDNEAGPHLLSLDAEARLDWQILRHDAVADRSQSGFLGKYIAVKACGTITDGLTYAWRQRLSRTPKDHTFWDQTDFLDLKYESGRWDVSAGKQVVLIGGYEYDRAPINLMCPNLFVANVACYQFGLTGGVRISRHDHLSLQAAQSLFATPKDRDLYCYNLMWRGSRPLGSFVDFSNIWSVNEVEYEKGRYCNYVALGNKFTFNKKVTLLLDIMTRTYPDNNLFKNNTFMGELSWDITPAWRLTGKASYDCNRGVNLTECTEVARGSQLAIGGVVGEWFPVKNARHAVRAHAALFYARGTNKNSADMMQNKTLYGSVGITWHMNFLNLK